MVLDLPKGRVHPEQKNAAGECRDDGTFGPAFRKPNRQPGAEHSDHERVKTVNDDHTLGFRPGGGRIGRGEQARGGRKSEEDKGDREKDAVEPF